MRKHLFIIEAPGKVSTLTSILNNRYKPAEFSVLATSGRLLDLPDNTLGMDMDTLELTKWIPLKEKLYSYLENKILESDYIHICTDDDIEGEVIAMQVSHLIPKDIKQDRLRFTSLTTESINTAISNPDIINMEDVRSGIARRLTDRIIGFALSRHDWDNKEEIQATRGTVGRILTPTISALDTNPPLAGVFSHTMSHEGHRIDVEIEIKDSDLTKLDDIGYALSKLNKPEVEWEEVEESDYNPMPWNGGEAILNIVDSMGFTASETTKFLQELYEEGRLSYPRSDSRTLSEENMKALSHMASEFGVDQFSEARLKISIELQKSMQGVKYNVQGAHEGLMPTDVKSVMLHANPRELSPKDQILYLITKQLLKSGYDNGKKVTKTANVKRSVKNADWHTFESQYGLKLTVKSEHVQFGRSPQKFKLNETTHPNGIKKPKSESFGNFKYHERSLDSRILETMLSYQLGRPSTYVYHINKVKKNYLNKDGLLNKKALQSLRLADFAAPLLTNPVKASLLEEILMEKGLSIFEKVDKVLLELGLDTKLIKDRMPDRHKLSDQSKVFDENRGPKARQHSTVKKKTDIQVDISSSF